MPTPEEITEHHVAEPPAGHRDWVIGGRPRTGIEVLAGPGWPETLDHAALDIEHVGSTSVPHLPGDHPAPAVP